MLRHLQRPVSLILLPAFLLQVTGCYHTKRVQQLPDPIPKGEHLSGITTLAGKKIQFEGAGVVRNDTVFARVGRRDSIRVPVDSVQRWWLTRPNSTGTGLLVLGVLFVGVTVVALATKESCPFVYSWNGEQYVFDAEPYGGAITRGLERDDYSILSSLAPEHGSYRLLVTNEVNETQMTNLFELWAVNHAPGIRIVPDDRGVLHAIGRPVALRSATDQAGRDLTRWLSADDGLIWEPLPIPDSAGGLRDDLVLTFPRPAGVTRARLITRVGTSLWGSHMLRALLQIRGRQVTDWYAQVDSSVAAADSVRGWAVRQGLYGLPLEVEGPGGWQVSGVLGGGGPFLVEERATTFELPPATGDSLRIRIHPSRGFWALNYLAVDYGPDQPVRVDTLHLRTATASGGANLLPVLSAADTLYHAMPNTGDRATIEFPAPPLSPGLERTVILHSRGYYRLHLEAAGEPDTALLRRIAEEPGAAARYSASQFSAWALAAHRN